MRHDLLGVTLVPLFEAGGGDRLADATDAPRPSSYHGRPDTLYAAFVGVVAQGTLAFASLIPFNGVNRRAGEGWQLVRRSEWKGAQSREWYRLDVSHPGLGAYQIVLYRQEDRSWAAEIPAIAGCYGLMATREEAVTELARVFDMIAQENQGRGAPLPEDTTEIANA